MAFAKKGDVFVPELLEEAILGVYPGMTALRNTGAVLVKTGMPAGKAQLGDVIKIPYFGTIGELEDLAADGDALTPRGISTTVEQATVKHSGIAIESTWWAQASGAEDPYKEMARQVGVALERKIDSASLAEATKSGGLVEDVYNASVPVTLNFDTIVEAKMLWGDEQDDIVAMVVHSKVQGDLYKLKDSTGRSLYVDATEASLPRFAGMPVVVSDRLTPSSDTPPKYTTLLLKRNAITFWIGDTAVLEDEDILAHSNVQALHVYWAAHRYVQYPGGTKSGVVKIVHN